MEKLLQEIVPRPTLEEDLARAVEMMTKFADYFKTTVPRIEVVNKFRGVSIYWRGTSLVRLRRYTERVMLDEAVIHEYAHHLTYQWFDKLAVKPALRPKAHGKEFYEALLDVVRCWYGDVKKYHWNWEYSSIQNKAIKDGYGLETADPVRLLWKTNNSIRRMKKTLANKQWFLDTVVNSGCYSEEIREDQKERTTRAIRILEGRIAKQEERAEFYNVESNKRIEKINQKGG